MKGGASDSYCDARPPAAYLLTLIPIMVPAFTVLPWHNLVWLLSHQSSSQRNIDAIWAFLNLLINRILLCIKANNLSEVLLCSQLDGK